MLEEDAMHIGTEEDVLAHVLDISDKKTQLRGLLGAAGARQNTNNIPKPGATQTRGSQFRQRLHQELRRND